MDCLREPWENIKPTNICVLGVPEREDREKGLEKIFKEITAEKFSNVWKQIVTETRKFRESQAGSTQVRTHKDT